MTKAQEWAKKRNFAKFRLRGAFACIGSLEDANFMCPYEKNKLITLSMTLYDIIYNWERNNKESKKKFIGGK
jgi:hypothetical protein